MFKAEVFTDFIFGQISWNDYKQQERAPSLT